MSRHRKAPPLHLQGLWAGPDCQAPSSLPLFWGPLLKTGWKAKGGSRPRPSHSLKSPEKAAWNLHGEAGYGSIVQMEKLSPEQAKMIP